MEAEDFAAETAQRWGRIRLINLMLQYQAGVIDDDLLRDFARWVSYWQNGKDRTSPCRFSTPKKRASLTPESFYHRAKHNLRLGNDCVVVRAISFSPSSTRPTIWSRYEPYILGSDSSRIEFTFGAIETELQDIARISPPFKAEDLDHIDKNIGNLVRRLQMLQLDAEDDPVQRALQAVRVHPVPGRTVNGNDRAPLKTPLFASVFQCGSDAQDSKLSSCMTESYSADRYRDLLGFDHYGRAYRNMPIALGFIAFRFRDLADKVIHRPTMLDNPSQWRFKGVYGARGRRRGDYGYTVNLAALDKACEDDAQEYLRGAMEVVISDSMLQDPRLTMYLGFLGVLRLSRGDFRNGIGADRLMMANFDEAFEEHLMKFIPNQSLQQFFVDGYRP